MVFSSHNPSIYKHKDDKLAAKLDKLEHRSSKDIEHWIYCVTAAQCPPQKPYCWMDEQHCARNCRYSEDCPGPQYCGDDKQCHPLVDMEPKDIYVWCDEWSDCPPWMGHPSFCWMDMMRCGRYCRYNSECAATNYGPYCWRDQGRCYNYCEDSEDCRWSPTDSGACIKDPGDQYGYCLYHGIPPPDVIHCADATDCPKKQPYCWMDEKQCSKYCRSSEDCPDEERCEGDGQCYTDSTPPHKKGYIYASSS